MAAASPSPIPHSPPLLLESSEPTEQEVAVATAITKTDKTEFNFCKTDPKSIWSQIKRQNKHIKLKRRWLIGLKLTKTEKTKLNKSNFFQNSFLSESLLREDDIFYESVRAHVEGALGGHGVESENCVSQDDMHLIDIPDVKLKRLISSCLNNLTNKGLYNLAMILHGGSIKSELTRCNLKKIIKGTFSSVLGRKRHDPVRVETRKKIFELLNNPQHFRDRCGPLSALISQSDHVAVKKVLHGLENLPTQTLIAMKRILKKKKKKAPVPQLQPSRNGWGKNRLIKLVEKLVTKMLSPLDSGNELQEPLAKAMAVSELSRKLMTGYHSVFSNEFYQFSPEVKSLQNDIMNAIWSVRKQVVKLPMLRNLQLLIEPEAVIPTRSLRAAFVHFLTEFLFQCSDMDRVPKSLTKILDSINRGSNNSTQDMLFQKSDIEEEVDRILSVSAQARQIVLDFLPGHGFDQDFTDAYMEQLEESEDSGSDMDDDDNQLQEYTYRQCKNEISNSMDSDHEAESIGDFLPFQSHPFTSMTEGNVSFCLDTTSGKKLNSEHGKLQPENHDTVYLAAEAHNTPHNTNHYQEESKEHFSTCTASKILTTTPVSPDRESDEKVVKRLDFNDSDTKLDLRHATNLFHQGTKLVPTKDSVRKNQYLAIQDSCDKTGMLAYDLIGHMLEGFATDEGLDLNLRSSSYLRSSNQVEDGKGKKKRASSGKHSRGSTIVQVINELIPSFPDSGMERLKKLLDS